MHCHASECLGWGLWHRTLAGCCSLSMWSAVLVVPQHLSTVQHDWCQHHHRRCHRHHVIIIIIIIIIVIVIVIIITIIISIIFSIDHLLSLSILRQLGSAKVLAALISCLVCCVGGNALGSSGNSFICQNACRVHVHEKKSWQGLPFWNRVDPEHAFGITGQKI